MRDYRERLYVPLAWWLLAVPTVVTLGAYAYTVLRGQWPLLVIGLFAIVAAAMLWSLGSAHVEVGKTALTAGGQRLPLSRITEVIPLDEQQTRLLRGPRGDPSAVLYSRPYLKHAVYLALGDQQIPYWLIGTRHPEELAAAIDKSRAGNEHVA
jgi:hypothetical protein